eukprot:jgi/Chrzof1/10453/UNPLg00380.t1
MAPIVSVAEQHDMLNSHYESARSTASATFRSASSGSKQEMMDSLNQQMFPMHDRIKFAAKVRRIIASVPRKPGGNCLPVARPNHREVHPSDIASKFSVVRRIGSSSKYGGVFVVKYQKTLLKPLYLAIKRMPITSFMPTTPKAREIRLYEQFGEVVAAMQSPNFPVVYGTLTCNSCQYVNENLKDHSRKCYILFNELASGDLKTWLHEGERPMSQMTSMMAQLLAGLCVMHASGWVHNDLHWGNALYHQLPPGGYWHYKLGSDDIYIKNTGQRWMLWDFGLAAKLSGRKDYVDAYRIAHVDQWCLINGLGWGDTFRWYCDHVRDAKRRYEQNKSSRKPQVGGLFAMQMLQFIMGHHHNTQVVVSDLPRVRWC